MKNGETSPHQKSVAGTRYKIRGGVPEATLALLSIDGAGGKGGGNISPAESFAPSGRRTANNSAVRINPAVPISTLHRERKKEVYRLHLVKPPRWGREFRPTNGKLSERDRIAGTGGRSEAGSCRTGVV